MFNMYARATLIYALYYLKYYIIFFLFFCVFKGSLVTVCCHLGMNKGGILAANFAFILSMKMGCSNAYNPILAKLRRNDFRICVSDLKKSRIALRKKHMRNDGSQNKTLKIAWYGFEDSTFFVSVLMCLFLFDGPQHNQNFRFYSIKMTTIKMTHLPTDL